MLKIEQVVVGEDVSSTQTIKPEPVITPSLQPCEDLNLVILTFTVNAFVCIPNSHGKQFLPCLNVYSCYQRLLGS